MAKKITGFIIGAILVTMIAAFLALNITTMASKYNVVYDNSTLAKYALQIDRINNISATAEENTNSKIDSDSFDILGDFFKSGYTALKVATASGVVVKDMASDGLTDSNLGLEDGGYDNVTEILKNGIMLLITITIVIGIIISILVKREEI